MKKFLRRFSSAVSPQVFATSLESLLARDQVLDPEATVPTILREFVRFLSTEKALATEGIFRLAGSGKAVKDIRERIEKTGVVNFSDVSDADISAVASLFKQWIRELPEALIPETFYDKIMQSAGSSEDLRLTLSTLPPLHLKCIRYLFRYLLKVSANEDLNKMSISNLSVVFAINVFRCPSEPRLQPPGGGLSTADQASYFAETLVVTKVMSFLLENYSSVFGADDEDLFKDDRRAMQAAATQKAGQEEAAQQKILQSREAPDLDSDNNSDSGSVSSMDSAPRSSFEGSPRLERSMLSKLMNRKRGNTVGEKSKAASTDAVVGRARSSSDPRLLSNQDILAREIKVWLALPSV
ncbi:Rho GTPase activation protein [Phlyctochytrium arcticum]|nr:Rho GTPase activation protein [Phlyctochytrium arcticum]